MHLLPTCSNQILVGGRFLGIENDMRFFNKEFCILKGYPLLLYIGCVIQLMERTCLESLDSDARLLKDFRTEVVIMILYLIDSSSCLGACPNFSKKIYYILPLMITF